MLHFVVQPPNPSLDELLADIEALAGADWFDAPNVRLHGRTPREAIDSGDVEPVRDIVESIRQVGIS